MREVFISYKSGCNDATIANELYQQLEAAGISCWMAPYDIPYGCEYDDCIVEAIESCKVMVVVFSHHTLNSQYVYEEIRIAYDYGKDVIRFKLDDTQLKGKWNLRLGARHWIDATGDYRQKIPELIAALQHKLGTTNKPLPPAAPTDMTFTVNGVSFKMIRVDGGKFIMGATPEQGDDAREDEKPPHQVSLSTFFIGETQVTQELWQAVMKENPSKHKGNLQRPVESISWNDCQIFINKLNEKTCKKFRLPTEAEWEYAARGGIKNKGRKYAGSNKLDDVAWYRDNSEGTTHAVKSKAHNALGLYDMSGNVFEWCQDSYGRYIEGSTVLIAQGVDTHSSTYRVTRGGSWFGSLRYCRVSSRGKAEQFDKNGDNLGLRLALDQ